jgi:methylmalonyl-CoA/ethylmalonyl-CoA epimerase
MTSSTLTFLPSVSQIGFVVADLQSALGVFEPLFGPFTVKRFDNRDFEYRGRRTDCVLDVAFGMTGSIELELLCPVSGEGPHREFLAAGRVGVHHFQYRYVNIDATVARLESEGYERIWYKRLSDDCAVAYLERRDTPMILELVEPLDRADRTRPADW